MPRDIPILATSGIFVYASLSILFERLAQGDGSISVYLVLAALFAWPAVAVFNRWAWGRKARKIAQVLASAAENHLPMDTLRRLAPLPNFDKKLRHLIAKGYLQNVRLDRKPTPYCSPRQPGRKNQGGPHQMPQLQRPYQRPPGPEQMPVLQQPLPPGSVTNRHIRIAAKQSDCRYFGID